MVAAFSRFASRNAVGLLALFVALGGTSYALTASKSKSFVGRDGRVHACVRPKTGAIQLVHQGVRCRRGLQAVAWSQRGAQGPAGVKGDPGPAGSIQGAPAGGDLAGSYPAPTIAPAHLPIEVQPNPGGGSDPCLGTNPTTGVFCGTGGASWSAGAYSAQGVQFWRDRLGEVHVRGEAHHVSNVTAGTIFVLPPGDRPATVRSFPIIGGVSVGIFNGAVALLSIMPDGKVALAGTSFAFTTELFLGEIEFRTDA